MAKPNKKGGGHVTNAQYNASLETIAKLIESETGDKKALLSTILFLQTCRF